MTFLHAYALALAGLAPVVIVAYLVRRRTRERVSTASFLWDEAFRGAFSPVRGIKLRNLWSLALALSIVTSLVLAAAGPTRRDAAGSKPLVVILDDSRSMNALESNGETRFSQAKSILSDLVAHKSDEREIMILTTSDAPQIQTGFTRDYRALRERVSALTPGGGEAATRETLALARRLRGSRADAEILVLSDGAFDGIEETLALARDDATIQFHRIGGPLENAALLGLEARRSPSGDQSFDVLIDVANFSPNASSFDVELYLDDELIDIAPFDLGANERTRRVVRCESTSGGVLTGRLGERAEGATDALAADDELSTTLPAFPKLTILLCGAYDRFIETALRAQPNAEVRIVDAPPETLAENELLVIRGANPTRTPRGKVALISPENSCEYFALGDAVAETFVEESQDRSLTRYARIKEYRVKNLRETTFFDGVDATIYASAPEGAAVFEVRADETTIYALNFSISDPSLSLQTIFPILFTNLVCAARGLEDDERDYVEKDRASDSNLQGAPFADAGALDAGELEATRTPLWKALALLALRSSVWNTASIVDDASNSEKDRSDMTLYFTHPLWLTALGAVAIVLWFATRRSLVEYSRARRLATLGTRALVALFIVLALAGATVSRRSQDRATIFLIDASDSIDAANARRSDEFAARVRELDPSAETRVAYFGKSATFEGREALDADERDGTDLEGALFATLATVDPFKSTQIVLMSDGVETRGDYRRALRSTRSPIHAIPLPRSTSPEVQTVAVEAPERAKIGAPFKCRAVVRSATATRGTLSFYRNGALIETRAAEFAPGENRYEFEASAGANDVEVELLATLSAEEDETLDNNEARARVVADGASQLLIVAKNPENLRNFERALRTQDFQFETTDLEGLPESAVDMEKYDAIFLIDAPSTSFTLRQQEALKEYVGRFGGGLIAIGGENAFVGAGVARSPLDDLLPIKMKNEKEKEKPSLAIALVIDRSGSMDGEKLALTKDAAKGVVELLAPQDYLSVIAFDSAPREVVPLQNVASPTSLAQTIGAIEADGATNIYPALEKAANDLSRVNAKFKHVILLTDGQSEPGDYGAAIDRATANAITVSTVGVGSDCDRFLLEKLATDGAGRFYYCEDAHKIPQIFARETKLADRSTLNETPFVALEEASSARILSGTAMETAPPLLGSVVSEAKSTSEVVLTTETGDPLLAFRRYGLGRAVAFTSDVDGRWSSEWLDWDDFPRFWGQVTRFAARDDRSDRSSLALTTREGKATLVLDARDEYDEYLNGAETTTTITDSRGRVRELAAPQLAPGIYASSFSIAPREKYAARTTALVNGESAMSRARIFEGTESRESDVNATNETCLREIAATTGGAYSPSAEAIAAFEARTSVRGTPLRTALLALALILYVVDVYLRRGILTRAVAREKRGVEK